MAELRHGVRQGGANIVTLQIGEIGKNFVLGRAVGEHFEDIDNTDAHAANTGPAVALLGANGDTGEKVCGHYPQTYHGDETSANRLTSTFVRLFFPALAT